MESWKEVRQFSGWIAGPMIGVHVHHVPPSKPCYLEMTGDQLDCPYCKFRGLPEWKGYLPIYRDNGKPMVVIIHLHTKSHVEQLRLHEPVTASRGKGRYDLVNVVAEKDQPWYRPGQSGRHEAADLRPWLLLTLWKEQPLIDYFAQQQAQNPLPTIERAALVKPKESAPPAKFDLKREVMVETFKQNGHAATVADLPPTFDQAEAELRQRLKEKVARAERNGKGG